MIRGIFTSRIWANNSVTVYASGKDKPKLKITADIFRPDALAIDSSQNLYVSNRTPTR